MHCSRSRPACLPLSIAILLAATGTMGAADRRKDLLRLSIATFNARFLFDGVEPEGDGGFPWKRSPLAARRHLQDIAEILRGVDADLVHISEVENLETLKRLALEIGDPTYRAFLVPGHDDFTRQNVGLLTRIDPDSALERTDEWAAGPGGGETQGVAKNYAARITVGTLKLTLVGAHLLAFPEDPERRLRREGQAEVLRRFSTQVGTRRGRFTIVLGDLNDLDPIVPDANGHVAESQVLQLLSQVDASTPEDDLWNPIEILGPEARFTAFVDRDQNGKDDGLGERSLTDHVLVPLALAKKVVDVRVFAEQDPLGPSDHFPLKVTLDLSGLEAFLRGDADGNGTIDTLDALRILNGLFAGQGLQCADACDVDDDGRVRLSDAVRLLHRIHRGGDPLPPPGPRLPGPDPTADDLECR